MNGKKTLNGLATTFQRRGRPIAMATKQRAILGLYEICSFTATLRKNISVVLCI